jgi:cell division control protein 7
LHNVKTGEYLLVDFGLAQTDHSLHTKPFKCSISDLTSSASTSMEESSSTGKRKRVEKFVKPSTMDLTRSMNPNPRKKARPSSYPSQSSRLPRAESRTTLPGVPRAGTRGFRAPEVLLRCADQSTALDVWSAGIIFLSVLTGRYPIFKPDDDFDALYEIAKCIGTGNVQRAAKDMGRSIEFPEVIPDGTWKDAVLSLRSENDHREWSDDCFDLLEKCLALDPFQRVTAEEALRCVFIEQEMSESSEGEESGEEGQCDDDESEESEESEDCDE